MATTIGINGKVLAEIGTDHFGVLKSDPNCKEGMIGCSWVDRPYSFKVGETVIGNWDAFGEMLSINLGNYSVNVPAKKLKTWKFNNPDVVTSYGKYMAGTEPTTPEQIEEAIKSKSEMDAFNKQKALENKKATYIMYAKASIVPIGLGYFCYRQKYSLLKSTLIVVGGSYVAFQVALAISMSNFHFGSSAKPLEPVQPKVLTSIK